MISVKSKGKHADYTTLVVQYHILMGYCLFFNSFMHTLSNICRFLDGYATLGLNGVVWRWLRSNICPKTALNELFKSSDTNHERVKQLALSSICRFQMPVHSCVHQGASRLEDSWPGLWCLWHEKIQARDQSALIMLSKLADKNWTLSFTSMQSGNDGPVEIWQICENTSIGPLLCCCLQMVLV